MRGVTFWLLQRVSGVILVAGMFIHFFTMHFSGADAITHEAVMARFENPLWVAFNFAFLVSVIYHGFNGVWGILLEYVHSPPMLKTCQAFIFIAATMLTFTGVYILTI